MKLATNSALAAFFLFLASGLLPCTWGARTELSGTRHSDASGFGFSPGGNGILVDNLVGVSDVYTIHMKFRVDEAPPNDYIRLFKFILDDHSILPEDPFDVDDQFDIEVYNDHDGVSCTGALALWDNAFAGNRLETTSHSNNPCTFEVVISRDANSDVRIYLDGEQGRDTHYQAAYVDYFTDSDEKFIIRNETILLFEDNTIGDFTNDEGTGSLLFLEVHNEAKTPEELIPICMDDAWTAQFGPYAVLMRGEALQNGRLRSSEERFILNMQPDGHLVFYEVFETHWKPLWATQVTNQLSIAETARLDETGNFVVEYDHESHPEPVWTAGIEGAYAIAVLEEGNVLAYDGQCKAIYSLLSDCRDRIRCTHGREYQSTCGNDNDCVENGYRCVHEEGNTEGGKMCCPKGYFNCHGKCVSTSTECDCVTDLMLNRGAGVLVKGESLQQRQYIEANGSGVSDHVQLFLTYWGRLILRQVGGEELWDTISTNDSFEVSERAFLDDISGDLIIQNDDVTVWNAGISNGNSFVAAVFDFGNLIVYDDTCQAIWSTLDKCEFDYDCSVDQRCSDGVCREMVVNMFESTTEVLVSTAPTADSVTLVKESGDSSQYSYVTANTTALQVNFTAADDNKYKRIYFLDHEEVLLGLFPNGRLWTPHDGDKYYVKGDKFSVQGVVGDSFVTVTRRSSDGDLQETFDLTFPEGATIPAEGFDVELAFYQVGSSFEDVVFLSP